MRRAHGRVVEIDTLEQFDQLTAEATQMEGWRIQGVDLRDRTGVLCAVDPFGALLLGCPLTATAEQHLIGGGAMIFPELPALPFDPYRTFLYSPDELYEGLRHGYDSTPDARSYAWSRQALHDAAYTVARGLHDTAIDDALSRCLEGRRVVGVMGGHALERGARAYADAARLGRDLVDAGWYVATGGGPGAMEAANLGAYLADDPRAIDAAIDLLAAVPSFHPSISAWAGRAFDVRARWPEGTPSLGIPTWFYGHEPPNVFADHVAKYFQNSLREDTLLRNCNAGIVFLPGAGGTVQEIFQDACENYYADPAAVAPMVLVGKEHWTSTYPAWPLLQALARGRPMEQHVHLVDDVDEVAEVLGRETFEVGAQPAN